MTTPTCNNTSPTSDHTRPYNGSTEPDHGLPPVRRDLRPQSGIGQRHGSEIDRDDLPDSQASHHPVHEEEHGRGVIGRRRPQPTHRVVRCRRRPLDRGRRPVPDDGIERWHAHVIHARVARRSTGRPGEQTLEASGTVTHSVDSPIRTSPARPTRLVLGSRGARRSALTATSPTVVGPSRPLMSRERVHRCARKGPAPRTVERVHRHPGRTRVGRPEERSRRSPERA